MLLRSWIFIVVTKWENENYRKEKMEKQQRKPKCHQQFIQIDFSDFLRKLSKNSNIHSYISRNWNIPLYHFDWPGSNNIIIIICVCRLYNSKYRPTSINLKLFSFHHFKSAENWFAIYKKDIPSILKCVIMYHSAQNGYCTVKERICFSNIWQHWFDAN